MSKVVLVTGADYGLGYSLVEEFLNVDATVVAGKYLSETGKLEGLKKFHGDKLHIIPLDISNIDSVKGAVKYFKSHFEWLDVLVNNAGILGDIEKTIFDEIDYEDIDNTFQVNALGPLKMTNQFISHILKSKTKLIVNISSEAGSIGNCTRKNWFGYCMSKSALNMQSKLLYNQLREHGVNILVFHPGWVKTHMRGSIDKKAPTLPEQAAKRLIYHIDRASEYVSDKPAYIDNDDGQIIPW